MSVEEAAAHAGVKPSTVHSWIQQGWLAPVNPRPRGVLRAAPYLISSQTLDQFLTTRKRKPRQSA